MKKRGSYILGFVTISAIAAGGVYMTLQHSAAQAQEGNQDGGPAALVAMAKATSAPYVYFVENIGKLEARQQTLLSAEVGGRVASINFDSGKVVRAGEVLVRINDEPEQAELIRLRGELATAKAQLDRVQELQKSGAESRRAYDDAKAQYDAARGGLEKVLANINQKTIRAPFDGNLGIRQVHLGQYLQAGTPITTLTNPRGIRVDFNVSETDNSKLRPGQSVTVVTDSYPNKTFDGKINAIDPQLNDSHIVNVQAELDDKDGLLRPGMYARVKVAAETRNELVIPESAITYNAYGETVFQVYKDERQRSRVRRVNIKAGERRDGYVVVATGLKSGDEVVTSGQVKLTDGVLVQRGDDSLALNKTGGTAK
ncbi:secretion protein HlyD [Burkholderia ubonensis]|uniref:efflux RND transporter periplasmic adaptor subunit n=1 Tax=Burkholderia ubonensis TaxID=101571 RepID=UPI000758C614|nr:efflux RND transporter periplasmic adaptor subunit [Burkholderia ubonensis]KVT83086.1 secretion protein HlyD [Burkholderia ubonensis]